MHQITKVWNVLSRYQNSYVNSLLLELELIFFLGRETVGFCLFRNTFVKSLLSQNPSKTKQIKQENYLNLKRMTIQFFKKLGLKILAR